MQILKILFVKVNSNQSQKVPKDTGFSGDFAIGYNASSPLVLYIRNKDTNDLYYVRLTKN